MEREKVRKPRAPRDGGTTETEFLDAAERLFGQFGFEGAKVRAIAEESGANLGALHYYWGSKKALFKSVCERRLRPIVEERLRLFDQCVARAQGGVPVLEEVLEAALLPAMSGTSGHTPAFGQLLARTLSDPSLEVQEVMQGIFDEASFRYVRLLRQCCHHLNDEAFYWRLKAVFGVAQAAYGPSDRIIHLSHGKFTGGDHEEGCHELVRFMAAGLLAPASPALEKGKAPRRRSRPPAD